MTTEKKRIFCFKFSLFFETDTFFQKIRKSIRFDRIHTERVSRRIVETFGNSVYRGGSTGIRNMDDIDPDLLTPFDAPTAQVHKTSCQTKNTTKKNSKAYRASTKRTAASRHSQRSGESTGKNTPPPERGSNETNTSPSSTTLKSASSSSSRDERVARKQQGQATGSSSSTPGNHTNKDTRNGQVPIAGTTSGKRKKSENKRPQEVVAQASETDKDEQCTKQDPSEISSSPTTISVDQGIYQVAQHQSKSFSPEMAILSDDETGPTHTFNSQRDATSPQEIHVLSSSRSSNNSSSGRKSTACTSTSRLTFREKSSPAADAHDSDSDVVIVSPDTSRTSKMTASASGKKRNRPSNDGDVLETIETSSTLAPTSSSGFDSKVGERQTTHSKTSTESKKTPWMFLSKEERKQQYEESARIEIMKEMEEHHELSRTLTGHRRTNEFFDMSNHVGRQKSLQRTWSESKDCVHRTVEWWDAPDFPSEAPHVNLSISHFEPEGYLEVVDTCSQPIVRDKDRVLPLARSLQEPLQLTCDSKDGRHCNRLCQEEIYTGAYLAMGYNKTPESIAGYLNRFEYVTSMESEDKTMLWTTKYSPITASHVCGNGDSVRVLYDIMENGANAASLQEYCDFFEQALKEDWEEFTDIGEKNASCPLVCLVGPNGVGKTATVDACLRQLSRNYVTVDSSCLRNKETLEKLIGDLKISPENSFWSRSGSISSAGNNKSTQMDKRIVFVDEIDILFASDKGFSTFFRQLLRCYSGLIVVTCNSIPHWLLKETPTMKVLPFRRPLPEELCGLFTQICYNEQASLSPEKIGHAISLTNCDLRAALLELQSCTEHCTSFRSTSSVYPDILSLHSSYINPDADKGNGFCSEEPNDAVPKIRDVKSTLDSNGRMAVKVRFSFFDEEYEVNTDSDIGVSVVMDGELFKASVIGTNECQVELDSLRVTKWRTEGYRWIPVILAVNDIRSDAKLISVNDRMDDDTPCSVTQFEALHGVWIQKGLKKSANMERHSRLERLSECNFAPKQAFGTLSNSSELEETLRNIDLLSYCDVLRGYTCCYNGHNQSSETKPSRQRERRSVIEQIALGRDTDSMDEDEWMRDCSQWSKISEHEEGDCGTGCLANTSYSDTMHIFRNEHGDQRLGYSAQNWQSCSENNETTNIHSWSCDGEAVCVDDVLADRTTAITTFILERIPRKTSESFSQTVCARFKECNLDKKKQDQESFLRSLCHVTARSVMHSHVHWCQKMCNLENARYRENAKRRFQHYMRRGTNINYIPGGDFSIFLSGCPLTLGE